MRSRIKHFLGMESHGRDVLAFFTRSNASVGYYAGIMLAIAWLAVLGTRLLGFEALPFSVAGVGVPLLMLACNVSVVIISRCYLNARISRKAFQSVLVAYMFVSVLASGLASLLDFVSGGQVVIFLLQVAFCTCLFVEPPIGALLLTSVTFVTMSVAVCLLGDGTFEMYTVMVVSWLAIMSVSVGRYRQALAAAHRESELRSLSTRDELTGLPNRRALRMNFSHYLNEPIIVVMADLDDFKYVNDACGHTAGDAILEQFAHVITGVFPGDDIYRYGGDEFLALLAISEEELLERSEELRAALLAVKEPRVRATGYNMANTAGYVCGVARNEKELRLMITLADVNLLRAKQRGKDIIIGSKFSSSEDEASLGESLLHDRGVDELTGMPTRSSFRRQARELIDRANKAERVAYIVHFDIEDFKIYNSQKGYESGDELLRRVGSLVKSTFTDGVTSHLSDDHFVVAVIATDDFEQRVASVCEGVAKLGDGLVVVAKAGIYVCHPDDPRVGLSFMADCAKVACDSVKGRYDELYRYFDEQMMARVTRRYYVVNNLDKALREGYIRASYQRVVRTVTGKVCGYEALAKWEDPECGTIPASEFVPILEDARLIHKLDLFMLHAVCEDHKNVRADGVETLPTSVNLSRLDFELCDLPSEVSAAIASCGISPELIHFEITESSLADSAGTLKSGITSLRELGHEVWVDDFGSGFSSLNMLKEYEFDALKIDMEFFRVRGGDDVSGERARRIVASTVNMAKRIGMGVIAEGVASEEQRSFLSRIGCGKIQGELYGLSRYDDAELHHSENRSELIESEAERAYFDKIDELNMLSANPLADLGHGPFLYGRPIAVVEFRDDDTMHYLQVNKRFLHMIQEGGTQSLAESEARFNTPGPFRDEAIKAFKQTEKAGVQMRYSLTRGNITYCIDAAFVVRREGAAAFLAEVQCFDSNDITFVE
jgi:diguanylate cyclase (GGDEF)-like protein